MRTKTKPRYEPAGLLAEGDRGTLTTAVGDRLPVRVAERETDAIALVLMLGSREMLDAGCPTRMVLECASAHGIARLRGEAELGDDDVVRFHAADVIEVIQRRRFFRVRTPRRVEVACDAGVLDACSVDISGGGMLITGPETLALGDRVRFRLHLGVDEAPVEGDARVVRTADEGQRAIAFEQIPRQEEERLIRFLFDRQRAERAFTRGEINSIGGTR